MKLKQKVCMAAAACLLSVSAAWAAPAAFAADGGVILLIPQAKAAAVPGSGSGSAGTASAGVGEGTGTGDGEDYGYGTGSPDLGSGESRADEAFDDLAKSGVIGFLQKEKLPKNMVYVSLVPNRKEAPMGQLQVKDKKFVKTAEVFHATLPDIVTSQVRQLFQADPKNMKASLDQVNQMLFMAQPMINEWIRKEVLDAQKRTGETWPMDMFSVELRDIQGVQLMKGTDQPVYTVSGRIIPKMDGWVIPLYVKAYLFLQDGSGRAMMLVTTDEERETIEKAGDRIVKQINQK